MFFPEKYEETARELLGITPEESALLKSNDAGRVYLECMAFTAIRADQITTALVEIGKRFSDLEKRVAALETRRIL